MLTSLFLPITTLVVALVFSETFEFRDFDKALQALNTTKYKWLDTGVTEYAYRFQKSCECLICDTEPIYIVIKNGTQEYVEYDTYEECDINYYYGVHDINYYYDAAINYANEGLTANCVSPYPDFVCNGSITFTFDDTYFYPTAISLNYGPQIADGNSVWTFTCLTPSTNQPPAAYNAQCYQFIIPTTVKPTSNLTKKPRNKPTSNPTKRPTSNPTNKPTSNPTKRPTSNPINRPTSNPSKRPTARPTDPDTAICGDMITGQYNNASLTFIVHLPYFGDLKFDATASDFTVTDIEVFTKLNISLSWIHGIGIAWIYDKPAGDYKFLISSDSASTGIFSINIQCFFANHSFTPTFIPTIHPIIIPTQATEAIVSLSCDQDTIGLYNGKQIQFHTTMTFLGQMTFDTRASNFDVSTIEVYDAFNALIVYTEQDNDGSVSFIADVGTYIIKMKSDSVVSGIYRVTITCAHINDDIFSTTDSEHKQTTTQYILLGINITDQHLLYSTLSLLLCWCFACSLCCLCKKKKKKKEPPSEISMINHILSAPNDTDAIDIIPFDSNCTAENPAMDDYDKMTYEAYIATLVQWLKEKVYLPQYAPLFIRNGYDSLQIIAQIESRKELKSIGIHDKAHQVLLMNQIAKLKVDMKFEDENDTNNAEEGRIENESSLPQAILDTNYDANYSGMFISNEISSSSSDSAHTKQSSTKLSEYARCDNCFRKALKASGKRNDGKFYCDKCYRIDVCAECRNTKIGRDDEDYGRFFCNECWGIYEDAVVNDVEGETIVLYDDN